MAGVMDMLQNGIPEQDVSAPTIEGLARQMEEAETTMDTARQKARQVEEDKAQEELNDFTTYSNRLQLASPTPRTTRRPTPFYPVPWLSRSC
ncbi:hypothetical protein ColLi_11436 [Colletotrichum liriopes]|uniref:Uncharacterized protein n=1 Tax=Colletotrichum liriopes TaxID=708192 RepID=A0AA37GYX5_9PEZI|nr:hypothetical protein ColLi_11436 [Colletotrichum liriopes]